MEWSTLYGKDTPPTHAQIAAYIDSPLWRQLNDDLSGAYRIDPKIEHSGCSMQAGWNIKYRKNGKSLCTLYPMPGYFIALVVVGEKEMPEAELMMPTCCEYVQAVFAGTRAGQGQKWLMIAAKDEDTLRDAQRLMALRVPKNGEK